MTDATPETPSTRVSATASGFTLEFDLGALLAAIDQEGKYLGYDPEADEARYGPYSLRDAVADLAAQHITKQIVRDVKASVETAVRDSVLQEVSAVVHELLENGTMQRTNEWGGKIGEEKPLKQIIVETATDLLTKPTGDGMRGGRPTVIQKIITEEVTKQFKAELQAAVAEAKAQALAAVKTSAAEVITETIRRATTGL